MDSNAMAAALLEAAWITARIAAGISVLGTVVALFVVHADARHSPVAHRRAGAGPRIAAMLLACALAAVVTVRTIGQAEMWLPPAGQAVAAATATLAALGGGLFAGWAAATLGVNLAADAVVRRDGALVTGGPFALVRHPFYAAIGLLGVGATLAFGSLAGALVFVVTYAPAAAWRAALEEEVLAEAWPDAWPAYAAKTPRFVPRW
jgi:protein-S-isoprenylcysteine O-methyltransferase Ste14